VARRKLSDTYHPDETLTDEYWLQWGDERQPHMRDKILYLTLEEVAYVGPGAFSVASVCDRLGITYPMVNHYFGGRDQLLAEGAQLAYARYVNALWTAVDRAEKEPVARLAAWMREQIGWTRKMSGWGAILNFPVSSLHVSELMDRHYREEMQRYFERNIVGLTLLVNDLRNGTVTLDLPVVDDQRRDEYLADEELVGLAALVSFATLGAAVWNAGQHLPSAKIPEVQQMAPEIVEQHVERVIRMLQKQF